METIVGSFEIPEDLARELSDLLIKQSIRKDMLIQVINEPIKYNRVEAMLLPITAKIEALKMRITTEFVPPEYNDERFTWAYDGYEVAGNKVNIFELQ